MAYQIGYFVGSLASRSINRTLSQALIRLAPDDLEFTEIPIKDLPLYSYDYDDNYPPVPEVFGDDGSVADESTEDFLRMYMNEHCAFVERVLAANAPGHIGTPEVDYSRK